VTYEERQRYRELVEEVESLRGRLSTGDPDAPVTREDALALLELVEAAIERVSPERWDRALEAVAGEAARRVGPAGPYRN
jgi:hypothetical protein